VNIYLLRERDNKNYFTKNKKWSTRMSSARIFTDLGEARKTRSAAKEMMGIHQSKIEIVEYQLTERTIL